ncbi:MAG: hypothetical protein K9J27_04105 [Bacteroidales bacterium]|nr:hypothetical protein [Bacteroidales bacterium]
MTINARQMTFTNMKAGVNLSIHTTIHSYNHSSIQPFIHSTIHPFNHSSIQPFIHSTILLARPSIFRSPQCLPKSWKVGHTYILSYIQPITTNYYQLQLITNSFPPSQKTETSFFGK